MNKNLTLNQFMERDSHSDNIGDAVMSFARKSSGNKDDLDILLSLQNEYLKSRHQSQDFHFFIDAGGYLGQKYNEIAEYIFEKIISSEQNEIDNQNFLLSCITVAAKINPCATEFLWKLWMSHYLGIFHDVSKKVEIDNGELYLGLGNDVMKELIGKKNLFDIASPEVIEFLVMKFSTSYYNPPVMSTMLINVLGNSPIVQCQKLDKNGNLLELTKDVSEIILPLFRNPDLISSLGTDLFGPFLLGWCNNHPQFKAKVMSYLDQKETNIAYLAYYLKGELRHAQRSIVLNANSKDQAPDSDNAKLYERELAFKPICELWIKLLEDEETREEEYVKWLEDLKISEKNSKLQVAFDFITDAKNNLIKRLTMTTIYGSIEVWLLLPSPKMDFSKEVKNWCEMAARKYGTELRATIIFNGPNGEFYLAQFGTEKLANVAISSMRDAMSKWESDVWQMKEDKDSIPDDPLMYIRKIDPNYSVLGLRGEDWNLLKDVTVYYYYPHDLLFPSGWSDIPQKILQSTEKRTAH